MDRRKKVMIGVIGVIVLIVAGVIIIQYNLSANNEKALQIAQEYLSQKYTQEMQCLDVRHSRVDPSLYHVASYPANNPDLVFEVLVQSNLTLKEESDENGNFAPDNYYFRLFGFDTQKQFERDIQEIFGGNARVFVHVDDPGIYGAYKVPIELNELMTAQEMSAFLDYYP